MELICPLSFDLQNPKIIPDHDKFEPDRWDSPELKIDPIPIHIFHFQLVKEIVKS